MQSKKIILSSELMYLVATVVLAFAVAMLTAADFGVSMIVAPAYIFSLKFNIFTFGQSEYIIQAVVFILFCIIVRRIKLIYFTSFLSCLIYGAVLDLWRVAIPLFNPAVTSAESIPMALRIILFAGGELLTAVSIAIFFRCYIFPQVYDFFVKCICEKFSIDKSKFKIAFDFSFLALALILSLAFFGEIRGIGIGTLVIVCVNGVAIGAAGKLIDKFFEIKPTFKKLEEKFVI